jgi:RsiW-degrading membrane proteinase PrsW (M82 family)
MVPAQTGAVRTPRTGVRRMWDSGLEGARVTAITPLSNGSKVGGLVVGAAVGLGMGVGAQYLLPSPKKEHELEQQGVHTISDREARATLGPAAFVFAAAVGLGIGKRSDTAALTTATLGAAAMLASTGASAMINADNESADKYLRTIGVLSAVGGGAFAVGASTNVPLNTAKLIGLGSLGLAAGILAPETFKYVASIPGDLRRSYDHRGE